MDDVRNQHRIGIRGMAVHEEQLVQLLKGKDLEAFEQLIDKYKRLVEKIAFQYGIEPNEITDVVQEVFCNFYRKMEQLEPGQLSVWVFQQSFLSLKDYHNKDVSKNEDLSSVERRYGYYIENKREMLLQYCLRELDNKWKQPIILLHFYNQTFEEISVILKINVDTVRSRLQRGEELLKEKYEKILHEVLQVNSYEKDLRELLGEINYYYERLPSLVNKQDILMRIEKIKASHKWKKLLPTAVGIIGLLLFSTFTVKYIQDESDQQAFQEQQKTEEREIQSEADSNPEVQQVELDPELVEHLNQAKEQLATELEMEDVNGLISTQMIEMVLKDMLRNYPDNREFIQSHQKEFIDKELTPPSVAKKNLLKPDKRDEKFMTYLYTLSKYEGNFQGYLDNLLLELNIPIEEYDSIVSSQDHLTNYDGPEKLKELIQTLQKQGYYLTRNSEYDKVTVEIDFVQVKENVEQAGFNPGYLKYLDFTIDYGDQFHTKAWDEHDEILLELESILVDYGHFYSETIKEYIISDINTNLHYLIWGNTRPKPLPEEDRQVFYQFLEENPDSVFWDVFHTAVQEYEASEWMETIYPPDFTYIKALFDERFGTIKLANFELNRRWPKEMNSIVIYKELQENFDPSQLVDLSPLEMVSLYDYASGKDEGKVYNSLKALKTFPEDTDLNLIELRRHSSEYVFTEYPSENNAIVHLADWNLEHVTSVELIKDNNIWQVAWIYKNNSSN